MSHVPKLGPYKTKREIVRDELKRFYKEKRKEDALVGRRVHELVQVWIHAKKTYENKGDKVILKTTPEAEDALAELQEIKEEPRFRDEFPSFAKFRKFVRKNKLTFEDLMA